MLVLVSMHKSCQRCNHHFMRTHISFVTPTVGAFVDEKDVDECWSAERANCETIGAEDPLNDEYDGMNEVLSGADVCERVVLRQR